MEVFSKSSKKNSDAVIVLLLLIIIVLNCIIFWKQSLHVMVDVGREFIIPNAILEGKVLYRDILNIYGPLGYIINAAAYKLLGVKFSSLNFMGAIASSVFVYSCYFISREFTGKLISFVTAVLMCSLIFNSTLYNFLTPYSYNAVYGLASYALSGLFLIKYVKKGSLKYIMASSAAAGFCLSNKIDYYWILLINLLVIFYIRPLGLKNILKTILCFLIFPLFSLLFLLCQGLNLSDIINAFLIIKRSAFAPSMVWLHKSIGLYPNISYVLPSLFYTALFGGGALFYAVDTRF